MHLIDITAEYINMDVTYERVTDDQGISRATISTIFPYVMFIQGYKVTARSARAKAIASYRLSF